MNASVRILIVDDHREIREVIAQVLSNEGFAVTVAADGGAMRRSLQDRKIDLVILDLMLPGEDGLSLCRELRTMMPTLPVIMVTAKGEEVDRVVGLEVGADDYVTKPFSSRELVARIKAVLRRARPPAARPLEVRSYRFAGREEFAGDGLLFTVGSLIVKRKPARSILGLKYSLTSEIVLPICTIESRAQNSG